MASIIVQKLSFLYEKACHKKSLPSSLVRTKEYQTLNKRDLAKTEVSCRWGHTVLPGFVQQV